jgi:hypothetical protein
MRPKQNNFLPMGTFKTQAKRMVDMFKKKVAKKMQSYS